MSALRLPVLIFVLICSFLTAQAGASECAFGRSTADLAELLDYQSQPKVWVLGQHISLHSRAQIESLSQPQRRLLLDVLGGKYDSENEALDQISGSEGYMTFFSNMTTRKDYALIASFPGDNEFGAIVEIKYESNDDIKILNWAAVVTDGDLEDCKVH